MAVKFTINGTAVEAEAGDNVLNVARRYGFEIPSLCHHEAVSSYGACRLCLVEVNKGGRKKITTSCNYEVLEGLEVTTETDEIRKHRAMVLELISSEAPGSKTVQKLASEYGVKSSRFTRKEDAEQEREDCILCGLCTRVCDEIVGVCALTFNGRGDKRSVGPAFLEQPESCIGCGSCASVCPSGYITREDISMTRKIWDREFKLVACETCGSPMMTEAFKSYALEVHDLPDNYYTTCSACKKNETAAKFAKVGI